MPMLIIKVKGITTTTTVITRAIIILAIITNNYNNIDSGGDAMARWETASFTNAGSWVRTPTHPPQPT